MGVFLKNGAWWIDYRVNGRRKRQKIGPNKRLAERVLAKRQVEIAEGKFLDVIKDEKIKFKDFANTYIKNHAKINKKSWESDVHRLKPLIVAFGDKYLFQITTIDIEKFKSQRLEKVSPASVNREIACVKCMFNKAIRWGLFHRISPAKAVCKFKEHNQRLRFLSTEELSRLYDQCSGELLALVKVAVYTGMRRGEILSLTWNDVDISRQLIYIRDSKSGRGRVVPMNETVQNVFLSLKKLPDRPNIFGCKHREGFEGALKRAQIKDTSFHTLRHTFASHLTMAGVDILTVSKLLGHSDIKMTMRYAHLSPDYMANAVRVMDTIRTPSVSMRNKKDLQLVA